MTVLGQGECIGLKERLPVWCIICAAELMVCFGWKCMLFGVVGSVCDVCGSVVWRLVMIGLSSV